MLLNVLSKVKCIRRIELIMSFNDRWFSVKHNLYKALADTVKKPVQPKGILGHDCVFYHPFPCSCATFHANLTFTKIVTDGIPSYENYKT